MEKASAVSVNEGGFRLAIALLCFVALGKTLVAQEVEGSGKGGQAIFSPVDYTELTVPISPRVGVSAYGFYLGNVRAAIALLEVPVSLQKHLIITPSYLFVNVPAEGLLLLTNSVAYQSYKENQFRLAATAVTSWHGFVVSDRNMYVRRFTPTGDVNRYRNKIYLSRPMSAGRYKFSPFVFDEVYHDFLPGPWLRRNWIVAAVDLPINPYLTFQPSYIRQGDQYLRSVNFLGMALLIRIDPLLPHKAAIPKTRSKE